MPEVYANRMTSVNENDWKTFVEQRTAAAKAEREIARLDPLSRELAVELSLELLTIYESLHGDPFIKDAITLRDEEEVRQTWKRLRERWRSAS